MLDGVLPKAEKVWSRHTVAVLPIPDIVRRTDNGGPRSRRSASNNRLVGVIAGDDLELGTVTAIEDRTVVYSLIVGIDRREVSSA